MTPDERQLITGLFERMRPSASQTRDRDAEALIGDQVRAQPYAPYLLSQTVIVQDQALRAANDKIQQLEAQVRQAGGGAPPQEETSFLGSIGKSIFGSGQQNQAQQGRPSLPTTGGLGPAPLPQEPGPFRAPGGGGPWAPQGAAPQSSGFLHGALGAAAGVAGGVLLADGIRGLFSGGNNPFGIASGMGGGFGGGGFGNAGGETIVNNYYDSPQDSVDDGDRQGGDFGNDSAGPGGYTGGGYSNDV